VSGHLDARGCLTEGGLTAIAASPPGQGPPDAAAHLASCARCQRRFLALAGEKVGGIRAVPGTATPPPLWRTALIAVAVLIMLMIAVVAMRSLLG